MSARAAAFGLAVFLTGLGLPFLDLVLAEVPGPPGCSKGRCCCAGELAGHGDRPCLRRSCGCDQPGATPAGAPVRIEAVLPGVSQPTVPEPRPLPAARVAGSPPTLPHPPPVPPPRRPLPA